MSDLSALDHHVLVARLLSLRTREREATAELIAHLAELDRRRSYTAAACSSLTSYCIERLGYSENEAQVRVAVARLSQRLPQVLDELRSGSIHLTGLFLLSGRLTAGNCDALLAEARGKSRREIEAVLARWFPRPDVLPSVTPLLARSATMLEHDQSAGAPATMLEHGSAVGPTMLEHGSAVGPTMLDEHGPSGAPPAPKPRVQPLSATSYRVEFTASTRLHEKLVQAQNLLGHAIPNGDLAALFERAVDALLRVETKRRFGAGDPGKSLPRGRPRKRRAVAPGSRHVPVDILRVVWQRDGGRCTYTDSEGRRCSEQRFVTVEHIHPHALGGAATVENLCLLCSAHNSLRAREVFGEDHVRKKIAEAAQARGRCAAEGKRGADAPDDEGCKPDDERSEPDDEGCKPDDDCSEKIQAALVRLGFRTAQARRAVTRARAKGVAPGLEPFFRAALAELTPDSSPGRG